MAGAKSVAVAGLVLAILVSPAISFPQPRPASEQWFQSELTSMGYEDAVTDMQESIINEEQDQDYSVQEQQNPGTCATKLYVMAFTSGLLHADSVNFPTITVKLTNGEEKSVQLYDHPDVNDMMIDKGDLWKFPINAFQFTINNGCVTKSDIVQVTIKNGGNDGWNIESVVTTLHFGSSYVLLTTNMHVNRWIDGNYSPSTLSYVLSIVNPEAYLLFSTWFSVSRMNLDGSGYEVLVDSSTNVGPQAVDYHLKLGLMFWNQYNDDKVIQANLDGSNHITITSDIEVDTPNGLAVDWINNKLYFSYADVAAPNTYHMAVYDIIAGGPFQNIMTSSVRYYEIAVDPIAQKLYYWTAGNELYESGLAGENQQVVFTTTPLDCTFSLALNIKLYWTESCAGRSEESVRSLDLSNPSQESTIVENSNVDSRYGVAVYEDTVYWTGNAHVYSTSVTGGGVVNIVRHIPSYDGTQFRGIVVVHPELQPDT